LLPDSFTRYLINPTDNYIPNLTFGMGANYLNPHGVIISASDLYRISSEK
jgi:hypothetical protein